MLTSGIVVGVVTTLWVGLRLGVPSYLAPAAGMTAPDWVRVIAGGGIALAFAVGAQVRPWAALGCAGFGAGLWLVYLAALPLTSGQHAAAAGIAALAIGAGGQIVATLTRMPTVTFVSAGIAPLMPGLLLYRGIYQVLDGGEAVSDGAALLLSTLLTGFALAVGSSLGAIVARPVPALLPRGRRVG